MPHASASAIVFLVVAAGLLLLLPRRVAVIPVLLAVAYTTRQPVLELGPANLNVLRILVIVGMIRVLLRGERLAHGLNAIDVLVAAWAICLIGTSVFHTTDAWTFRIGLVLGEVGVYLLWRIFIRDAADVRRVFKYVCLVLAPLAVLMAFEKHTAHNVFGIMGGSGAINIRGGQVRAYGPFGHAILAGTVGATCLPMALSLWRTHRSVAVIGVFAATAIVLASTSSGPVMMVVFTCMGLLVWNVRGGLRLVRWAALAAIVLLDVVMKDPVYFLMARIDITGSSTGWHRAQLVRSSLEHLSEWWAAGTDYTRHWMPTGIHANASHTDITNHFLAMGVMGGLPLLALFILLLWAAFRGVGAALGQDGSQGRQRDFLVWTLGAMLFAQVMNFWSISLFDQSVSLFYLILASIGAVHLPSTIDRRAVAYPVPSRARQETIRWQKPEPGFTRAAASPPTVRRASGMPGTVRPTRLRATHAVSRR